jgi:pentatricopeptide repeat protein
MKNRGCPPNTASYTNLIHALCAAERLEEASRLFKDMKRNGCFPDVVSYTTLINGFCKLRKLDQGYQLLDDMIQQRCVPNQMTYSCLLREHERREELKEALDLFQEMSENGCDPDLSIYNTLLRLSCKLGKLNEASTIWNKMNSNGISPDLDTYTIFIHGLHNQGNLTDACKYFKEMVEKGVLPAPQYGTLKALLNTLLRAGKLEVAADLWDCMKKRASHINIFAYTIWIQALCSNGEAKEACSYCADMIEDGLLPQPSTYQMIMKGLRKLFNRRIADELRAKIRQLISEKNLSFKSFATQGVRKSTGKRKSRKRGGRTR